MNSLAPPSPTKTSKPLSLVSHDRLVRPLLKNHLRSGEWPGGFRLVDELNLGWARLDVAVVSDALHGFEIKAEQDSFTRFYRQKLWYDNFFDYLTLVTTLKKGDKGREQIPAYWGLLIACEEEGEVIFWEVRKATLNPNRQTKHLLDLLWQVECLAFLEERGVARGCRGSRPKMQLRMREIADHDTLSAYVCQCLKARAQWRDEQGITIPIQSLPK